ncbi:DUF7146 domain-containing protein [Lichenibacterium ramalinae]|uniref:Virulence-associated protein E n=1 Tax=Lichenibacterium ramalinae TaxID=2316527 RepID=A0A4Q2R4R5_9HYPH|nr:toprim domain-containing protein [Lichenibacterium ramalinae]RYB01302.1 virulence-associated protein E [Lichenibacterium ramalinae]
MSGLDLRTLARALGGEVTGRGVLAPGPGHSRSNRSLSVRPSASSPVGFVVHSFSGDDFATCRDYVLGKLGMSLDAWRTKEPIVSNIHNWARVLSEINVDIIHVDNDSAARIARAVAIWNEAGPASGSIVQRYLSSRGLSLDLVDNIHEVVRFHPRCPWRDQAEDRTIYVPAMVALMRSITTDEPQAVHRTRLSAEGAKVDRRMLGIAAGAAVKIDSDDAVTMGLSVGEGIESCLAARQLGFQPVWALASAGSISALPVLGGVEALTLLAENDPASDRAISQCAARWHAAGREVTVVTPNFGSDLNDAIREVA